LQVLGVKNVGYGVNENGLCWWWGSDSGT